MQSFSVWKQLSNNRQFSGAYPLGSSRLREDGIVLYFRQKAAWDSQLLFDANHTGRRPRLFIEYGPYGESLFISNPLT
jgi:hypothetical protein